MSADMVQIAHYTVTGITSVAAAVLAYVKFRDDKVKKETQDDLICKQDFQELKTKVAVLEERLENEIDLQDKIEQKIDKILEQL